MFDAIFSQDVAKEGNLVLGTCRDTEAGASISVSSWGGGEVTKPAMARDWESEMQGIAKIH